MFSGALTALVTPFRNGEVDVEALEGMVEFQIHGGIHGLVPCGTTGETPAMTEEEDRLVIRTVVRVAGGRVPTGSALLQQADSGRALPSFRHHRGEYGLAHYPLQHPWPDGRDRLRGDHSAPRRDPEHRGGQGVDPLHEHDERHKEP